MKTNTLLAIAGSASALLLAVPADAQQAYLGEIQLFANKACPANMHDADGAYLPVASNQALAALLAGAYGTQGDSFALPDLRGRSAVHTGDNDPLGQSGGSETAQLNLDTMPPHTHTGHLRAIDAPATIATPSEAAISQVPDMIGTFITGVRPSIPMQTGTVRIGTAGGGQPFSIINPYVALRYCVVTQGLYPPR